MLKITNLLIMDWDIEHNNNNQQKEQSSSSILSSLSSSLSSSQLFTLLSQWIR